ncbi:V-type ATP synthase subunit I, partial [Candidatus Woesearchaeota archaeon]|nr:V-type ATP synthase subunit I [Candidatus Woesearchaeota archaeon]
KNIQEEVIKELHKLKIMHIVEHSKNELADIGKPMENANRLSEALVRVRALITALKIEKGEGKSGFKMGLPEIDQTARKINEQLNPHTESLRIAEERISSNNALKKELETLKDIDLPLDSLAPYKSLACFTGYVQDEENVAYLKKEMSKMTEKFMLFDADAKKKILVIIFVDAKSREDTVNKLQMVDFNPINLADVWSLKGKASGNLLRIEKENAELEAERSAVKSQIEKLGQENRSFLTGAEEFLSQELEKAEVPLKFAVTKDSFFVKGWVPAEDLHGITEKLGKATNNRVFVHSESPKKTDRVPVKLNNPRWVKPFEFFMDMYSFPRYGEIDPTFLIFLTFPIFFGFMLGDFGYGIVSFALFYYLKKKFPKGSGFFNVLLLASVTSIVFGILYGEFFGLEELFGVHLPILLSRTHEVFTLLYMAVGIGIVHINTGLVLGFINEVKHHGLAKAIYEKGSWIILQIGAALLALSWMGKINLGLIVGGMFLALSLVLLYMGEGAIAIIELPSILSNILSYARLMAIGLSSVSLAVVVNEMAGGFFQKGGFFILAGILILLIGHVINIVLGLFGSFLHSLRLHYVEFFSKFFSGGATKYRPFGSKE